MGGGLGNTQQLSEKPFTTTAELNKWRQPGPGHYRLYVVSYRVWRLRTQAKRLPTAACRKLYAQTRLNSKYSKRMPIGGTKQLEDDTTAYQNAADDEQRKAGRKRRF
jgi:hypothetical protein